MGTDVYLEWREKSQAEEEKQLTGFDIGSGDVGYLRASIHMVQENALLRMLFPEKYWSQRSRDEYDFKGNLGRLVELGRKYLQSVEKNEDMEVTEEVKQAMEKEEARREEIAKAIQKAAGNPLFGGGVTVAMGELEGLADAMEWMRSVVEFFKLGMQKQEQGLKPYPYISW